MPNETKQDVIDDVADMLKLPREDVSVGSTEPRHFLEAVAEAMGTDAGSTTKPSLAAAIAETEAQLWDASCDSTATPSGGGGTVTLEGLYRIRAAVFRHVREGHGRH